MARSKTLLKAPAPGPHKSAAKADRRRGIRSPSGSGARRGVPKAHEEFLRKLRRYPADRALMRFVEGRKAHDFWKIVQYVAQRDLDKVIVKTTRPIRKQGVATITREVARIQRDGRLTDRLIARATGAAPGTVRDWLALRRQPSGVRAERVAELGAIVERLARIVEADYVAVWLDKPIAALDDEKPIDLLRRGECVRVARLVSSLEDSGAA